ncbi:ATP-binding protein [Vibrio cholerae]|uniref:AlbA family DNA-binding domain-containing protein n=1 Tax=Vibrio cholerae TaxID=666 RepID=UPI003967A7B6
MSPNIIEFLEQGESDTVAFLLPEIEPIVLAKTIAAFANSGGGTVLIGVRDWSFNPGIEIDKAQILTLKAKELLSEPDIFEVENTTFRCLVNICVITVKASPSLVLCNDGAYHRVNRQIKPMNHYEIQRKLKPNAPSLSNLSEIIEMQTKKIEELTSELAESGSFKSKLKDHLLGAIVGLVVGVLGGSIGL